MTTFTIPGVYPDWRQQNFYQGKHWSVRKRIAEAAHEQVLWAVLEAGRVAYDRPVIIEIVEYAVRPPDPDNVCSKVIIDGLRHAGVIADDTRKQVREVRLRAEKVRRDEDERIEVHVWEVNHAEEV